MTAPTVRAWSVVLSFAPPGPLHATLILAPDRESAVSLATLALMRSNPTDAQLHAVLASEVPAETLRHMLRAVEGTVDGAGQLANVMRLVPIGGESPIARSLHQRSGVYDPAVTYPPPPDDGPAAALPDSQKTCAISEGVLMDERGLGMARLRLEAWKATDGWGVRNPEATNPIARMMIPWSWEERKAKADELVAWLLREEPPL